MSMNKIVDGRLHDFHVSSDCKLMKHIKVIQHVNGIEHITDKLQTKSLEFTYEFIGNFQRKDINLTFDSKTPWAHNWHNNQHAIYLTRLKTQYLKDWS
jgi:hypothetical protein